MGRPIPTSNFDAADFARFEAAVRRQARIAIARLRAATGSWTCDNVTVAAEREFTGVRMSSGRPFFDTHLAVPLLGNHWAVELGMKDAEHDGPVFPQRGKPFTRMLAGLRRDVRRANEVLEPHGVRLAGAGILPSLTRRDTCADQLVPQPRFATLNTELLRQQGRVVLNTGLPGCKPVRYWSDGLGLESVTNGDQPHWSISTEFGVDFFNAGMLVAPVIAGLSGFAPYLFQQLAAHGSVRGKAFKASVRGRGGILGTGWLKCLEDVIESALKEPALLPFVSGDPDECLTELTLHLGSRYPLIRLILDEFLRLEYRFLDSQPLPDMVANNAGLIALNCVMAEEIEGLIRTYGDELFEVTLANMEAAEMWGANAPIRWPDGQGDYFDTTPAEMFLALVEKGIQALEDRGITDAGGAVIPLMRRAKAGRNGSSVLIEIAEKLPAGNRMNRLSRIIAQHSEYPVMDWKAA